jgi:hypothetical protein
MDDSVRAALVELVHSEGEAFFDDEGRVETRLRERAGDHPDDIAVLVVAVRAGVVTELLDVKPGLFDIAVSHLTSRMVRLYGADPDASRRAIEAWAAAIAPQPAPAPPAPPTQEPPPSVLAVEAGPTADVPPPERSEGAPRFAIPPWVVPVSIGVVALVALVVLLRTISGVLASGRTENEATTPAPATTVGAAPSTTAASAAPALSVPPDLSLGSGDVQVTLLWADGNDLDLHVIDPSGAEIYFSNPKSPSGGTLDHDDTAGCSTTGTHVENVFWPAGGAPPGRYQLFVKNYTSCGAPSRYSVTAAVKGRTVVSVTGTVGENEGDQSPVSEFSVP